MGEEKQGGIPLLGDKFPKMQVKTTQGTINLPDDYEGKWIVLFSHPGDFTPVCTTEFMAFERRREQFEELGAELIGLSVDQVFSHLKWVEWIREERDVDIQFPVIADELGEVSKALGMIHPGKGTNTVRSGFIVDAEGIIRLILYYPQEIGRNMDEILRALKALRTSDENGVATPANWPENEDVGANVIVPPAGSEQEIQERMKAAEEGEIECFDWWLCHRPLDE